LNRVLVGDVGGTHSRFAIVDVSAEPFRIESQFVLDSDFPTFADAVRAGLDRAGSRPDSASIAVAGPVTNGAVSFTNRGWTASEDDLKKLGFQNALLINDFVALAFAADNLPAHELRTIGPELEGLSDEPISIVGAGTGFGVSCLARFRGRAAPIASEGGHIGFAPSNAREADIQRVLLSRFGRVSVERILSGPGIENLYGALCEIEGIRAGKLDAPAIQKMAEQGDRVAGETIAIFCSVFGAVAGDFALAHGARGGVFLAGGVAQKLVKYLDESAFRAQFENKGRLSHYVMPIPTRLILTEDAAFLGAAHASVEFRKRS
jgi:glucokinase